LEAGFSVSSVAIPPVGVRVNLIGHRFNKYLSANIHYMRPVEWVKYKNVYDKDLRKAIDNYNALFKNKNLPAIIWELGVQ
jgi:hypothetical protein